MSAHFFMLTVLLKATSGNVLILLKLIFFLLCCDNNDKYFTVLNWKFELNLSFVLTILFDSDNFINMFVVNNNGT